MSNSNGKQVQVTIRVDRDVAAQIEGMAQLQHRSRNAEINILLEEAIDHRVQRDLDVARSMPGPT